jgi:Family of unknown function (DUF6483)
MIREDYIMRMIEQLVKVLSKILFNKETRDYQEAVNNIENAFKNILGLDYNLLKVLSAQDIISLLKISKDDATLSIKCIVIAKLLKERAEIENLIGSENFNYVYDYQKVLSLYLEGILNNKNKDIDLSNYYPDVKEIAKKLGDKISEDLKYNLNKFYEHSGEYDKAEDEGCV